MSFEQILLSYTEWLLFLVFFYLRFFKLRLSHTEVSHSSRFKGSPATLNPRTEQSPKGTRTPCRQDWIFWSEVFLFQSLFSPATFFITRRTTTKRFLARGSPEVLLLGSFKDKIEIVPPQSFRFEERTERRPSDGAGGVRLLVWLSWTFVTFDWPGAVGSLWASPAEQPYRQKTSGLLDECKHISVKLWGSWWGTGMLAAKYIG